MWQKFRPNIRKHFIEIWFRMNVDQKNSNDIWLFTMEIHEKNNTILRSTTIDTECSKSQNSTRNAD